MIQKLKRVASALAMALILCCVFCWPCPIPAWAIQVNPAPYSTETFTAGETLAAGDIVYIKSTDGKAYLADADGSSTYPAYGIVVVGGSASSIVTVSKMGIVQDDSSITTNANVYLSGTAGDYTTTAVADYAQAVGHTVSATKWHYNVNSTYSPALKSSTGDFTGAVGVDGNFDVNTDKFTVTAASGNTTVAGTLGVTGDVAVNTNKFNVTATSGNTTIAGTLGVTSDVAVNTNKFNVTAASGNTTVAGTLDVTGATGIDGNFDVATDKATINATTGDMTIAGDLTAVDCTFSGAATMQSNMTVTGDIVAGGGWIMPGFVFQDNIDSNISATAMKLAGSATVTEIEVPWAGSVVGVSIVSNEARTAGTATVDVTINGTVTGLQAVLNATDTTHASATQAKDTDTFAAGDRLGVKLTTDASWQPATADIVVIFYYESGGAS